MFHGEFNKWCDGCVRGKTRDKPHYKGSFDAPATHFGSRLIGDVTHMEDAAGTLGIGGTAMLPFNRVSTDTDIVVITP